MYQTLSAVVVTQSMFYGGERRGPQVGRGGPGGGESVTSGVYTGLSASYFPLQV